jgi:hypothetical protein
LARAGRPEAKAVVKQIIDRESKTSLYLLISSFGKVWTIELPPTQQEEILKTMLPTFFVEDLAVTDLHEETEEFKKRVIYGFDSLAKLARQNQKELENILASPEKYQVVCFFEPVKSRLVFVGRTEEIEADLPVFGSLFLCQAWSSYMDNLLTETNYTLSTLCRAPFPSEEEIQAMKDGELSVLKKNLSAFIANKKVVDDTLASSEEQLKNVTRSQERLEGCLKPTGAFKVGLLEAIFDVNTENLRNLPKGFKKFRETFEDPCLNVGKIRKIVEKEHQKRTREFLKRRRKILVAYSLIAALSAIFVLVGLQSPFPLGVLPFLIPPILMHAAIAIRYLILEREFHTIGRYPSPAFDQIQLSVLALTQAVYKFVATGNILTPGETLLDHEPIENKTAEIKTEK